MASEAPSFTSHREIHHFAGILFDLDGTLIDSTDAIVKHWHRQVCTRYPSMPMGNDSWVAH